MKVVTGKLHGTQTASGTSQALGELFLKCGETADSLLNALESLKDIGPKTKWQSVRKALKGLWGKEKVEEMRKILQGYRYQLNLHVLVDLR